MLRITRPDLALRLALAPSQQSRQIMQLMLDPASESETSARPPMSLMVLVAHASARSLLVAAVTTVFVVPRIAAGQRADGAFIAFAAMAAVAAPFFLLLPRAARGLRGVVGGQPGQATLEGWFGGLRGSLLVFLGFAAVGLVVLAGALKVVTHHRGLGGATFGVFGTVILASAAVASSRLGAFAAWMRSRGVPRVAILAAASPVALAPVALVLWGIFQGQAMVAAAADMLLLAATMSLAMTTAVPRMLQRAVQLVALPLLAVLVVVGFARLALSPLAGDALKSSGSLPGGILRGLELWSDRDGDGEGAFFGGRDCDEGDPARNSRAPELVGDGVDNNCDGIEMDVDRAMVAVAGASAGVAKVPVVAAQSAAVGVASAQVPSSLSLANQTKPSLKPAKAEQGARGESKSASTQPMAAAASASPAAALAETGQGHARSDKEPALPASSRPDMILVTLDTVRADHTSLYGYKKNTTPELSKLAARGLVFEYAYAPGSDTQRALIPLVSGAALSRTPRTKSRWPAILRETETVAERIKKRGYVTAAVSSFTWLRKDRGFSQGFDRFVESPFRDNHPERYSTGERAVKAAIKSYRWLKKKKKPLFLWVHFFDAHARYLQHPSFKFGGGPMARYDSEIAFVDHQLGRLVEAVEEDSKRSKQTLWIVHGSHGEAFGEHGQEGHGTQLYDEVLRVPMLLVPPGGTAKRYRQSAVSTFDIAPTLLDFAGATHGQAEGISLRPLALGRGLQRGPIVAHSWRRSAVIDWPYKLLTYRRRNGRLRRLLFNLQVDSGETKDLSEKEPKKLRTLIALHKKLASP
jgi:choline-sulfatase